MITPGNVPSFACRSLRPIAILTLLLLGSLAATAAAQPSGGLAAGVFEIDGNLLSEDPTRVDWFAGAFGPNAGVIDPDSCKGRFQHLPSFLDAAFYRDDHWASNAIDLSTFATGNKNNDCIAPGVDPWGLGPGSGPAKNDITETYSASYVDPVTGDNWLLLAFSTRTTNGDSEMDFEFNSAGLTVSPDGTQISGPGPDCGRTIGDFIVSINFTSGGTLPQPTILSWNGTSYVPHDITPPPGEQPRFMVAVNTAPVAAPCGAISPDGTLVPQYITRQFAEIAINLTKSGVDLVDYCGKPQSTLGFKTRSSASFTSSLKDIKLFKFHLVPSTESTIAGPTSLCAHETTTLVGPDPANAPSPITYLWSTGETTRSITLAADDLGVGSHPVWLVVKNEFGCSDSTDVVVNVHPEPQVTVAPVSVCAGESGTLTAIVASGTAPFSYSWSNGATTASISVAQAGEYCVTVTDAAGCQAQACGTFVVHDPVIVAVASQAVCAGAAGSLEAAVTSGTAPFTYAWSTGETTATITPTQAGQYCVTVTDANGCTGQACGTLTVRLPLQVSVADVAVCNGEEGTLRAAVANGTAPFSYSWNTGATTESIAVNADGEYQVTVTDANGCTGQASARLTVRAPVVVSLADVEICAGETATLTPQVSGATGPMTWNWSNGASGASIGVTQGGEYTVIVRDANGCEGRATATVTVHPQVEVTVADESVCFGETGTLRARVQVGTGPFQYSWSNGTTGDRIQVSSPGEYCVTVTDAHGCTGRACATFAVRTALDVSVADVAVCNGEAGTLRAAIANGVAPFSYSWNTGATTESITVNADGEYQVTVTDANGCTGQATARLTVRAPVVVKLDDVEICAGETVTLGPQFFGATEPMTCSWSTGATSPAIQVTQSGEYTVIVRDANGCEGRATATVTVHPQVEVVAASETVCFGETATLRARVEVGTGPFQYSWSNGATGDRIHVTAAGEYCVTVTDAHGCTGRTCATLTVRPALEVGATDVTVCNGENGTLQATVANGTAPFSYSWNTGATTQSITVGSAGEYQVTVTDANGCTGQATAQLTVRAEVVVKLGDVEICSGETATLGPQLFGATEPMTCSWSTGATSPTIQVTQPGEYTVTVRDANGCEGSATATVTVHPLVEVTMADQGICSGETATLRPQVRVGTGPYSYSWSNGATGDRIQVTAAGHYWVEVTDANGCAGRTEAMVTVFAKPEASVRDAEVCEGKAATLGVTATGGTAPYTYSWNTGETSRFITHTAAGEYCVTVTDANGCETRTCGSITDSGTPVCDIRGPSPACLDSITVFSFQTSGAAPATSAGMPARPQSPETAVGAALTAAFATPRLGLEESQRSSAEVALQALASQMLDAGRTSGPFQPHGAAGKVGLDQPSLKALQIEWSVSPPEHAQILSGVDQPNFTVRFTQMGHYVITLKLTSAGGCSSECSKDVFVVDCSAAGCPRTVGFWGRQCVQSGSGDTKFTRSQMYRIIGCVDARSDALDLGSDRAGLDSFCDLINTDDMNQRHQAKRQFAGMLANVCVGNLGIVASNGEIIYLLERTRIYFPPFEAETIGELIDEMDEMLLELEPLNLDDPTVKSRYSQITRAADAINNGEGLLVRCSTGEPDSGSDRGSESIPGLRSFKPTPNPTTGRTTILYRVTGAVEQPVDIVVYDIAGRRVRVLERGMRKPGDGITVWDGRDDQGTQVARGVYYVRGILGSQRYTSRVVVLRQ